MGVEGASRIPPLPLLQLPRAPPTQFSKSLRPHAPLALESHTKTLSRRSHRPPFFAAAASNAAQVLPRAAKAATEMEAMKMARVEMTKSYVDELALNCHPWEYAIDEHNTSKAEAMRDKLRASALARGVSWKTT